MDPTEVDADVLGIDIAKDSLVVTLLRAGRVFHRTFKNTCEDFGLLAKWLSKHKVTHVHACMEATGTYGDGHLRQRAGRVAACDWTLRERGQSDGDSCLRQEPTGAQQD